MTDNQGHFTRKDIIESCQNAADTDQRLATAHEELHTGICFAENYDNSVTVFGSARFTPDHPYYIHARNLTGRISQELGYAVVTGGGPGIMEAANRGAFETKGDSLGMTIQLPHEQSTNPYVSDEISFHYFFTRKVSLTYSAEAYIYFPGGFGTLDEFFEILTLVQTGKIEPVPIVLYGSEFWQPLDAFIKNTLAEKFETISKSDRDLYYITDNPDEVIQIIKDAPTRESITAAS